MSQPHEPEPPPGYIHTKVVAMVDVEGNPVDSPDQASRIEVEQVTVDGVVENVILTQEPR